MDTDWHIYRSFLPWKKFRFVDGTHERVKFFAWRRKAPDGTWQYRKPTEEEIIEEWRHAQN